MAIPTVTPAPTNTPTMIANAQSCLSPDPLSLTFNSELGSQAPASQTVTITDCGRAGNWLATPESTSWLSISPSHLSVHPLETVTLTVTVTNSKASLGPGYYTANITFTEQADGQTDMEAPSFLEVPVEWTIIAPSFHQRSFSSFSFLVGDVYRDGGHSITRSPPKGELRRVWGNG